MISIPDLAKRIGRPQSARALRRIAAHLGLGQMIGGSRVLDDDEARRAAAELRDGPGNPGWRKAK